MNNPIFWSIFFVLIFLFVISMLFLKKVLFFEEPNKKTKQISRIFLIGQIVFSILSIILFANKSTSRSLLAIMLIFDMFMIYGMLVVTSFLTRKQRKWIAFIIPIPLACFSLSIYNLSRIMYEAILNGTGIKFVSAYFLVTFFSIFVLIIHVLRFVKNSPIWKLENYVKGKTLSCKEEIFILLTALLLGISIYAAIQYTEKPALRLLLFSYGFILAIVILFTIYNLNGRRYFESQTQTLQRTLITTMADLVENRDENTGGHIKRTAKYVEVIAKQLKKDKKFTSILTDQYIADMIISAPLHDIGKIHVPDSILDKPGKLTKEEFDLMKTHTTAGYHILVQVEKQTSDIAYIKIAKQMAKSHHEWINGAGYPEGLVGDEIPLCAKILAVADVFDALVSKRCYKEPMPLDKAYEIIKQETGDHFDQDVSEAFFAAKDQIEQIMQAE